MRFNCFLSPKGILLLMLPLTCKGFNSLLLIYINTLQLMHMLTVKSLRCINTPWLGIHVKYTPWNILYRCYKHRDGEPDHDYMCLYVVCNQCVCYSIDHNNSY